MEKYSILIRYASGQYIATVPEFGEGLRAFADTRAEALTEIVIALQEKIARYRREGVELPEVATI